MDYNMLPAVDLLKNTSPNMSGLGVMQLQAAYLIRVKCKGLPRIESYPTSGAGM